MKQYVVNVVESRITPFVVEANDEWEAMIKAKDGQGYIHESGSIETLNDPTTWEVEPLNYYPRYALDFINEYL